MASSKQNLKTLLAQGKLETALDTLVRLTEHTDDAELRQRVLALSGQFAALKKQQLSGLLDDKDYRLQWNRIAAAVADIADDELIKSLTPSETLNNNRLTKTSVWKKWPAILAVLASVAGITGYTLRDVLWPKTDPAPTEQPAAEPSKKDTIVVTMPPAKGPANGKNNPHIEIKDKAKVGIISTGDSAVFKDIKQDF